MDDRLRALERAARASPMDRAATWAFIHALDLAGDSLAAWRERCQLARLGDARALEELDPVPSGARGPGDLIRREWPRDMPGYVHASGDTFLLAKWDETLAIDTETLDVRWTTHGTLLALAHGAVGIVATKDRRGLGIHDLRDGRELGCTMFEPGLRLMDLRVGGDKVLARCSHDPLTDESILLTIDLVDVPGAIVARSPVHSPMNEPSPSLGLARGVGLTSRHGEIDARDVVTNAQLYATAGMLEAFDDDGLVVTRPGDRIALLETLSGRQVWEVQVPDQVALVLTPEWLIVVSKEEELEEEDPPLWRAQALDRALGVPAWTRTLPQPRNSGFVSGIPARDTAYIVNTPPMSGSSRPTSLLAIDAGTGQLLWTRVLEDAVPPAGVQMACACPGGLLLLATGDRRTSLSRVGTRSELSQDQTPGESV